MSNKWWDIVLIVSDIILFILYIILIGRGTTTFAKVCYGLCAVCWGASAGLNLIRLVNKF